MKDLGDMVGALMAGLIRARRISDEETAVLAEYYRENPLLEGLSVPRIRIPELTIDFPVVIEGHEAGAGGEINDPKVIAAAVDKQVKEKLKKEGIKVPQNFSQNLRNQLINNLTVIKRSNQVVSKETIFRAADSALAKSLIASRVKAPEAFQKNIIASIGRVTSEVGLKKLPIPPSIKANIKTADVKERADDRNVVRIKVTFKEEGLEWTSQSNGTGGVKSTLQPE